MPTNEIDFISLLWSLIPKTKKSVKTDGGFQLNVRRAEYNNALRLVIDEANETVWQAKYGKGTIESWALLQSAISKIEPLTK